MLTKLFVVLVLFHSSLAAIYDLNDEDYALMPPVFYMDDYEECLAEPEGLYCSVDYSVVADEPSPLLTMMQDYSAHKNIHYNHTLLRHAVCITRTCKKFYEAEGDLRLALEACGNETLYNKYKLKVRVSNGFNCSKREKNKPVDSLDITVAVICIIILIINIVASSCDYYFGKGKDSGGLRYLNCFSIFRNWDKLISPPTQGKEARLQVLKGLHGFRSISTLLVIIGHSIILSMVLPENTKFIENIFLTDLCHILLTGTLIMQTFLIMASFLLVYNWLVFSEKQEPTWKMLPKAFVMRWLRLTPSYFLILGLTATWFGRIATGPHWAVVVNKESADCRRNWWRHLLYINNYFDDSECMIQAWYLAADTHLYFLASIVFVMCRTARSRKLVISFLLAFRVFIHTLLTYLLGLDGIMVFSPEFALRMFTGNPTFDQIYKRTHGNLAGSVVGMALGYIVYHWHNTDGDPKKLRKYRYLYWAIVPAGSLCFYSGTIFYRPELPSPTVNLLMSAYLKPVYSILCGIVIAGVISQFEDLYRPLLEWRGWRVPSQISFSAYLLHIVFMRNYIANITSTYTVTTSVIISRGILFVTCSFTAGLFYWLLVEAPFGNVFKEFLTTPEPIGNSKEITSSKQNNGAKKTNENETKKASVSDNNLRNFEKKSN